MTLCDTETTLYEPIVRVLTYYDIFEYPLKLDEIYTFLPIGGIDESEMKPTIDEMIATGDVCEDRGYYFLAHRGPSVVDRRISMEREGARMWRMARFMTLLMSHVPFVRGIFISGQLCRYIADEKSDIDYFIVTEPDRLWIVRLCFVLFRRIFLLNKRKYLCANYYITADNLKIRERNAYVACEVASLKPIYNRALFDRFMQENTWVSDYYPNFSMERIEYRRGISHESRTRRLLEAITPRWIAKKFDLQLMETTRSFWRWKFPHHSSNAHAVSLRTCRNESRAHPNDISKFVLDRYDKGLRRYGLSHD